MPSKSLAQHRLMEMVAHGGAPRVAPGLSPAVAKDFVAADKGKRFAKIKSMSQANSGGHAGRGRRAHTTHRTDVGTQGAYSMAPRRSK